MDDAVELGAVGADRGGVAEDALAERGSVERLSLGVRRLVLLGGHEEVGRRGTKVVDDLAVARGAWLDDFAREEVGVDDGQIVRRGAENGGHGGFSGGQAARQADYQHLVGICRFGAEVSEDDGGGMAAVDVRSY